MAWQSVAVVVVVAAAILFLVLRLSGVRPGRRRRPAQTFVPLATLRKKQK